MNYKNQISRKWKYLFKKWDRVRTRVVLCVLCAILAFSCSSKKQADRRPELISTTSVEEKEHRAFRIYQDSARLAIQMFVEVADLYEKANNMKKVGLTNLNIANIYDEHLGNQKKALAYAKKAFAIWETLKDTLQMANLLKYVGLLEGRVGNLEKAKEAIDEAISLYKVQGFEQGLAVSRINLADVYFQEGGYLESERLFLMAKEYWNKKGDLGRVFTNNLLGIAIYEQLKKPDKREALIRECRDITSRIDVAAINLKKFEKISRKE